MPELPHPGRDDGVQVVEGPVHARRGGLHVPVDLLLDDAQRVVRPPVQVLVSEAQLFSRPGWQLT